MRGELCDARIHMLADPEQEREVPYFIEVIVKKDHSENLLASNAPATEEKDSKLKTIFKQARNLKNGEKVDLQALGVNTDSKLAASTRSLHDKFTKVLDI